MDEEINRFLAHPDQAENLDLLFGTGTWREVLGETDPEQRRRRIHDIYRDQLIYEAGIKHVRSFEMLNQRNRTDYFLFFGTNGLRGLEKMKEAMWGADPKGTFQFSDYTHASRTLGLFDEEVDYPALKQLIVAEFGGKEALIEEVGDFVIAQTPFLRTHMKRQILKPMEESEEISITHSKPGRRRGTFPDGTKIHFR